MKNKSTLSQDKYVAELVMPDRLVLLFFFEEQIETDTFVRSGCMKELITEVTYVA